MPGPAPVELLADCGACGLESGVVETYDALVAACRFGLPARARCKLCGAESEGVFDRAPARAMREVAANRCPACLEELAPNALDERRCARCGASASLVARVEPADLTKESELAAALDAWAAREDYASRDALLAATLADPDFASLHRRLCARERIEAVGDPFANMGMRAAGSTDAKPAPPKSPVATTIDPPKRASPAATTIDPPKRPPSALETSVDPLTELHLGATEPTAKPIVPRPTAPPPPSAPPRAIVFPLVSVIAADGEIHPAERELVDRFLASEGLAPLADEEIRVHHPREVAQFVPKERREAVVQLMCESAAADGMPDESERRVIRAYAAAWHVPDDKVEFWMWGYENMNTSITRQLWLKIRRFVLSARWSDEAKGGT